MPATEEYIETAIQQAAITLQWQASDATEDGSSYPISESGDEYTERIGELIADDVRDFIENDNTWRLLEIAGSDAEQTGHDFILTANGHGVGFWDRGYDMPVDDDAREAYDRVSRSAYRAYVAGLDLAAVGPIARYLDNVGDALTEATRGYSFDAEFALWGDRADGDEHLSDELAWLMVENEVLFDDGMIESYDAEHNT